MFEKIKVQNVNCKKCDFFSKSIPKPANFDFTQFAITLQFYILSMFLHIDFQRADNIVSGLLTLKLPGPYVGMGGSLTVTVA